MQKGSYLTTILRSNKTVFTTKDIALMWHDPGSSATRVRLNYYVRKGQLYRIRKGLYAKNQDYSRLELATRIFTPAYVSFETILAREGMIFQYYDEIFVASYLTREITIDEQTYSFRKIKNEVLSDARGVENINETSMAGKERAFLDTVYVKGETHFDNLSSLDWEKTFEILPIYHNLRMTKQISRLYKAFNEGSP